LINYQQTEEACCWCEYMLLLTVALNISVFLEIGRHLLRKS